MIIFDTPTQWDVKLGPTGHLMSTLYGYEGSQELDRFAKRIGLKRQWLQNSGDPVKEHYDLMGARIAKAIAAGATEVTRQRLAAVLAEKRATYAARQKELAERPAAA
jgi:hypothetical protein